MPARSSWTSEMNAADEQLVRDRIERLPEPGDLSSATREIPIEPIGDRGDREDRRTDQLFRNAENTPAFELGEQHDDQERHENDPHQR